MNRVLRLPRNENGRDFVVGDIHGMFSTVYEALEQASFDPQCDRLIAVGDLVNRGPESHMVIDFLARPYVYSIRGNHEDIDLRLLGSDDNFCKLTMEECDKFRARASWAWMQEISSEEANNIREMLEALPIVIELESEIGPIGFVHANVPDTLDWDTFLRRVENEECDTIKRALTNRDRATGREINGVEGVARVFCGHTPMDAVRQCGNVFFLDTGVVYSVSPSVPPTRTHLRNPHLTLAEAGLQDHFYTAAGPEGDMGIIHVIKRNHAIDSAPVSLAELHSS